jgi:hypothetical protein
MEFRTILFRLGFYFRDEPCRLRSATMVISSKTNVAKIMVRHIYVLLTVFIATASTRITVGWALVHRLLSISCHQWWSSRVVNLSPATTLYNPTPWCRVRSNLRVPPSKREGDVCNTDKTARRIFDRAANDYCAPDGVELIPFRGRSYSWNGHSAYYDNA